MIVYIKTQNVRIVKEGRHLLAKKGNATYHTLFTHKLKQLLLFGNIEITHNALCQLMRRNVDTVYLTKNGRYLGRIASPESKNTILHKKQFMLLDDADFCLRISKNIISGKLANMSTFLKRIKRSRNKKDAGKKAEQILALLNKIEKSTSVDQIRGYEGRAASIYFQGLKQGFINNLGFNKRVRRPPTDPINSVLSLLYTFLMNRVYAGVRVAGLNPYPGFMHTIDYGRYSLVLDLMEEFRSIIADTLTISLFNLKMLQENDFQIKAPREIKLEHHQKMPDVSEDPIGMPTMQDSDVECFDIPEQRMEKNPSLNLSSGGYPVRLRSDAFRRVINAFEKKLTSRFYYPPANTQLSISRRVIKTRG